MTKPNSSFASWFVLILLSFLLLGANPLYAKDTGVSGVDLQFFVPPFDRQGSLGLHGSGSVPQGQFYFALVNHAAFSHLFQVNIGATPVDLVKHIVTTDLVSSYALTDSFVVGVHLPFHLYARQANFNTTQAHTTASVGDIGLAFKYHLISHGRLMPDVSLLFSARFPTGDTQKFLGSDNVVPTFGLIVDKDFYYVRTLANIGFSFREEKTVLGINFDNQFFYGFGVTVPLRWVKGLAIMAEIKGHFNPQEAKEVTSPIEWLAGVQKSFKRFDLSLGAGGGLNNAVGNPRVRGVFSLATHFGGQKP